MTKLFFALGLEKLSFGVPTIYYCVVTFVAFSSRQSPNIRRRVFFFSVSEEQSHVCICSPVNFVLTVQVFHSKKCLPFVPFLLKLIPFEALKALVRELLTTTRNSLAGHVCFVGNVSLCLSGGKKFAEYCCMYIAPNVRGIIVLIRFLNKVLLFVVVMFVRARVYSLFVDRLLDCCFYCCRRCRCRCSMRSSPARNSSRKVHVRSLRVYGCHTVCYAYLYAFD